jgi:hypothetical protein
LNKSFNFWSFWSINILICITVNGAGAVCDQKNYKFFISYQKEFMAGHMGVKGVY